MAKHRASCGDNGDLIKYMYNLLTILITLVVFFLIVKFVIYEYKENIRFEEEKLKEKERREKFEKTWKEYLKEQEMNRLMEKFNVKSN